jgi:hypothetical protein
MYIVFFLQGHNCGHPQGGVLVRKMFKFVYTFYCTSLRMAEVWPKRVGEILGI